MSNFDTIPVSIKQQLMSTLCEQLEDAIFVLDDNLRYLSVNPSSWLVGHLVFMLLSFYQKKSK